MSAGRTAPPAAPAALLYTTVRSPWAVMAVASPMCSVPLRVAGGNPVIEADGHMPTSPPVTTVGPMLVTPGTAARTPNGQALPKGGSAAAAGHPTAGVVKVHSKFAAR